MVWSPAAQLFGVGITRDEHRAPRLAKGVLQPRASRRLPGRPSARRAWRRATSLLSSRAAKGLLLSGRAAGYLLGLLKGSAPAHRRSLLRPNGACAGLRAQAIAAATIHATRRLARHPGHHGPAHPRGSRGRLWMRPTWHARATRPASFTAPRPRRWKLCSPRRPSSRGVEKRRRVMRGDTPRHPQPARVQVPGAAARGGPAAAADEPARGRTKRVDCRWPEHEADRRARQLPVPQLAPLVGAGPAARARGPRPRRRDPPLHVRRRLREVGRASR